MKRAFPWGKRHKFLQSFPEPSTDIPFLQYSVCHPGCECHHGGLEPSANKNTIIHISHQWHGGGVQCLRPGVWGAGVHLLRGSPLQDPQTAARWARRSPDRSWKRSGRCRTWSPLWWSGRPQCCSRTLKAQGYGITHMPFSTSQHLLERCTL